MSVATKISLTAQADAIRRLAELALPGCKAFRPSEAELIRQRAAAAAATLERMAPHADALREWLLERESSLETGSDA